MILLLVLQYAKWYLPMSNNNLAAPQRKYDYETSIVIWKSRHHLYSYSEGLLGVQLQN